MTVQPVGTIKSYHAHIYYDGSEQRRSAEVLREQIAQRFTVLIGRWHDRLVGPHARSMYQVAFPIHEFARFVPWLMLNRQGLAVLVHPNTGRPKRDHLIHALWLGEILQINDAQLPDDEEIEAEIAPNTNPTLKP